VAGANNTGGTEQAVATLEIDIPSRRTLPILFAWALGFRLWVQVVGSFP